MRSGLTKLARLVLTTAIVAATSGCSTVRSDYDAWIGHSSDELLESWGEPDKNEELGSGYYAYTWLADDGICRRTFMAQDDKITGFSETDCEGGE